MFNSCSKYTGGIACHSDFITSQAAKGKQTDTSLSLGFSLYHSLSNLISQDICVLMNAQCQMQVKWNPISSSNQVYFAQDPTGTVPENLWDFSVCERQFWYTSVVKLTSHCFCGISKLNPLNTSCPATSTVQLGFHPQQTQLELFKTHLFLMPLSDSIIYFLLYCSSIQNFLCTKNMRIALYLASSKNFASNSNNLALVPISQLYHADF